MEDLIRFGFRPSNLPLKQEDEKRRHQAHVEKVLSFTHSSASLDQERKALDALWRTELLTGRELVMTDQMHRLWSEYGLPSSFVRGIMWPWSATKLTLPPGTSASEAADQKFSSLIDLDLKRTLPFLGICNHDDSMRKSKSVLIRFSSNFPAIGYTQGMSYICTRLMLELNFDENKTYNCLQYIIVHSQTLSCLYRLNLDEIRETVELVLDSIAWENIPTLWLALKKINFKMMDYCLIEYMITMYVKHFNLRISGFIFDQFFLSGDQALYQAAIGILSLLEQKVLVLLEKKADIEEICELFTNANSLIEFSEFTKAFSDVLISDSSRELMDKLLLHPSGK